MSRIEVIHTIFNLIKSHCILVIASILLLGSSVYAQELNIPLIYKITVNDTLTCKVIDSSSTDKIYTISEKHNTHLVSIWLDSLSIKKYNLVEYRFLLKESSPNFSMWNIYPYKEFSTINVESDTLVIEARDIKKNLFNQKIILKISTSPNSTPFKWTLILVLLIGLILWIYYRMSMKAKIEAHRKEISNKETKYKELLTNYLPKKDFDELVEKNKDKTKRFKMVTVLFSNILGFTKVADQDNAEQLIDDIDKFNFIFDEVVKKLHIEKIKTVGDSYMCAGGIPQKNRTNPIEVVLAAFEMQQYMNSIKDSYFADNKKIWDLRMGIHTGPVFSNSTNNKKRLEIWGDTVNIASRMEASGDIGKVNITGLTYELVKDYFLCQYRGKMPVKYKGEIDMYFIEGFRPALSIGGLSIKPNHDFTVKLGLIRYDDLEEEIMNTLEKELPKNLFYHNLKHTIDVVNQVEIIGRHEGITDEEMLLMKTAALFHDSGFTKTYKDHEEVGVEMCKEILPAYDYTPAQINKISELIMVTKLPPKPNNHLEEIILDADLDYLGRVDFIPVSGNLYRELTDHKIIEEDINKWNEIQIGFISKHQYFTESAKKLRDVNKNNQLEAIRKLVEENN